MQLLVERSFLRESLEKCVAADLERLEQVEGIGPSLAASIVEWFLEKRNRKPFEKLAQHGVRPSKEKRSR